MSSHNKIIKCMHEMTGLPYSVCRKKLKENHWDLYYATGFNQLNKECEKLVENMGNLLRPAIEILCDATVKLINDVAEYISNIDWKAIKETVDEYNRQNNIEALPMEIPGEATGTEAGNNIS
jgi:hypothetical protein